MGTTTDNRHPLEMEAKMYWSACSALKEATRSLTAPDDAVREHMDEISIIETYTDWPPLKERCKAILTGRNFHREAV